MNQDTSVAPAANGKRSRNLAILGSVFALAGLAYLLYWLLVASKREVTEDAYVGGDLVQVSARVGGTVIAITGKDMDLVQAGDTLLQFDSTDAQTQLQKAANALAGSARQFRQQHEQANQLDAAIAVQKLQLARAKEDLQRREPLAQQQAIADEELAHARTAVEVAQAALTQTQRQASTIHALIDGTTARTNPTVLQAKAAYVDAWLAAQRNAVVAPVTGYVTQHNVQLGQRIQPGQTLLTIVPLHNLWVDANFKEAQLRNLRIGQSAEVVSDLYGSDVTYHGKVVGIGVGTGAAFALLPAQNASGNWIKVTQRVPVKIALDAPEIASHPLRIGLSTTTTIDTHDRSGLMLSDANSQPASESTQIYNTDLSQVDAEAERIIAAQL